MSGRFDNHMVGGQLGVRWFKQKDKWNLSGELRAFAAQNFQSLEVSTDLERTYYVAINPGGGIDSVVYDRSRTAGHASEFVFGTEIRAEAAYAITRDFSVRAVNFGKQVGAVIDLRAMNRRVWSITDSTYFHRHHPFGCR